MNSANLVGTFNFFCKIEDLVFPELFSDFGSTSFKVLYLLRIGLANACLREKLFEETIYRNHYFSGNKQGFDLQVVPF